MGDRTHGVFLVQNLCYILGDQKMKKQNNKENKSFMNRISIFLAVLVLGSIMTGCGSKNEQSKAPDTEDEIIAEASIEVQQPIEETVVVEESTDESTIEEAQTEDSIANLPNEEWVSSLRVKVERPTFLVFNELTGEKKELEDGAEYTLVEGDELGVITPVLWSWVSENARIYNTTEFKYNCEIYLINLDLIDQNTEFTLTYNNRDGEPVPVTVYLSK